MLGAEGQMISRPIYEEFFQMGSCLLQFGGYWNGTAQKTKVALSGSLNVSLVNLSRL